MDAATFKTRRVELGLTQDQLAELIGYGAGTRISEIENGKRPVTPRAEAAMRLLLEPHRCR